MTAVAIISDNDALAASCASTIDYIARHQRLMLRQTEAVWRDRHY